MATITLDDILGSTMPSGPQGSQGYQGADGPQGAQGGSAVSTYTALSSNTNLESNNKYILTAVANTTHTLPSSPNDGDNISIVDGSNLNLYPCTIDRNAKTIAGASEDLVLDVAGSSISLIYYNNNWIVIAA